MSIFKKTTVADMVSAFTKTVEELDRIEQRELEDGSKCLEEAESRRKKSDEHYAEAARANSVASKIRELVA